MQNAERRIAPEQSLRGRSRVSVRTLHLYDRLRLLRPAAVSPSGYCLYGEAELERLEHILALRFVGLRLDQIKELLGGPDQPLVAALRMQRKVIARQKQRLESALTLIERPNAR
jgi:DNA-binding transcriptional MerR regulator